MGESAREVFVFEWCKKAGGGASATKYGEWRRALTCFGQTRLLSLRSSSEHHIHNILSATPHATFLRLHTHITADIAMMRPIISTKGKATQLR